MAATIKQCSERLQANPEKVGVLNERGMARAKLKLYDEALEDYDKALGIKPDYADALYNRGRARMKLGDYGGAVDDLEKALELDLRRKQAKRRLAKASAKLAKQRAKGSSG